VIRAITLLSWWQLRNSVRTSLTDVRKLIPLLVFLFFIGTQVLSAVFMASVRPPVPSEAAEAIHGRLDLISGAVFVALALIALAIIDYGFSGGFLTFPLADVDYLFPSPVPRRLVLAYRLAARTGTAFFQAAFLFYVVVWRLADVVSPRGADLGASFAALCALFFCLGGYANLAFTLKLVFGFGRYAVVRRWTAGLLIGAAALVGYMLWQHGWTGLSGLARGWVPTALFYPCRLAADAAVAPLSGADATSALLLLVGFYAGTLAVLFARNENFYEATLEGSERAARLLQAAREQNWSAIFAIQAERRRAARGNGKERPYTVPPFGRKGMAVFWAHLCAAAKRPFPNFILPLAGGAALPFAAQLLDRRVAAFITAAISAYLLFILAMSGIQVFRQAIQRPIIRPLPIPPWQVVLADVAPRVLSITLFCWAAGAALWTGGAPYSDVVAPLLITCLPAAMALLHQIQYLLALWYPDAQDKLQQLLAGFISLFLTGGALTLMGLLVAVPVVLNAPAWLTSVVFVLPTLTATAGAAALSAYVYRRFEPRG
jgi:hypothetical protein